MSVLGIDLGGTKLAAGVFSVQGDLLAEDTRLLNGSGGSELGDTIVELAMHFVADMKTSDPVSAIGISVPGISHNNRVWAPNIQGWEDYPLHGQVASATGLPVRVESDRSCYIMGEAWKGVAQGCSNAVFIAVGTGIGAGILLNGQVINGAHGVAGAVGWMALPSAPGMPQHFELHASGRGMEKLAQSLLEQAGSYTGSLKPGLSSHDIFRAFEENDPVAVQCLNGCITAWAMAAANLVSVLNPEKIIFGGGIFGPAAKFIPDIYRAAKQWGQPISMEKVRFEGSQLGKHAGLYGAALLALNHIQ